ncbi:deoxyribose-phosphate aldolase [Flavobacterium sp. ZT3R18]|uniref:deoxyribose-phosphate aldolase n=1 Tax=Flavobacterium sp. ZT3R18 TaxID=2594429 RepID=UPI00117A74F5|nr:deoxyribose-phosphate aldolase [Flavobacterium sp. ZT3R18]TRX38629.1 deoxyribose-phosphate aldolase [Flavobacterium sp. ZT3R18]
MNVKSYLDSTYLKTAEQAGLSESENEIIAEGFVQEAIDEDFKLIMIRPNRVELAKKMIFNANSKVQVGTVIDFPEGKSSIADKLEEALQCIQNGADELDFVCNYTAFKNGNEVLIKEEILKGTQLGLEHHKIVKWIIEVAALNDLQIAAFSALIKDVVVANFKEENFESVFVKSSTGFYKTENNLPNGATVSSIKIMLENASPLLVKAAGGVRTYQEAIEMIRLGVKRIGTSGAKAIASGQEPSSQY